MSAFTLDDLLRIISSATGEPLGSRGAEEVQDTAFADLGVDSLALLETATRIERETGVAIPDDDVLALGSPRLFLDYVGRRLMESA